ncbi:hypothetical protein BD410DRAFT_794891 [Rickenella mellea]|uniref:ATPase domain-containing protein n=1 Tax=Rickenella mellea TaxID=50990 RepID=A0A4Y7PQT7_9AGAM|nr:hypothetical protein BD410DRAFT_794891 [Rickenella mellea]
MPNDVQKRNFFGLGEIVSVIANPGETVRSLAESRKLLQEARQEIHESRERAQLPATHTFSPLPGFFPRPAEMQAIERALDGIPSFTVLFGASSVGKTALLREVLSRDTYHVLHFDLRIAGFADISSLYMSFSRQMEQYFETLSKTMEGYEEFEKESWSFKHDRLNVERRIENGGAAVVKTSDIARLMELFQSSLLRYWQFEPKGTESSSESDTTKVENSTPSEGERKLQKNRPPAQDVSEAGPSSRTVNEKAPEQSEQKPTKKMPVFFIDEAHKLPALIKSIEAMKCILDSMLVLTKQDRLCHVIHATSDSFYQTWLRQLNVMQHCKIISIGDCSKVETRAYFMEKLLPNVPERLQHGLEFSSLYEVFGGKLAHWADYVADYVNANGDLPVKKSSHFLQAHALLNLQIIHASEVEAQPSGARQPPRRTSTPRGFKIYSPIPTSMPIAPSPTAAEDGEEQQADIPNPSSSFTAIQLLKVMRKLTEPGVTSLPYFLLCRELGVRAVDDMVRGRILELRWMETVTREGSDAEEAYVEDIRDSVLDGGEGHSRGHGGGGIPSTKEVMGPKLVPTTPVMRYAMREVLGEYGIDDDDAREGEGERSEYASLSDVEEY